MAYTRYTTRAFVCGSEDRSSSDRIFWLFTRDAGMIRARATSIRDEKSKLRFALQDFSYSDVSLVKGKYGWKIVGATPERNVYFESASREVRASLRLALTLLRRVAGSEEPQAELFSLVEEGISALTGEELSDRKTIEDILTLRILYTLGYVAPREVYHDALTLPLKEVTIPPRGRKALKGAITRAFEASQL